MYRLKNVIFWAAVVAAGLSACKKGGGYVPVTGIMLNETELILAPGEKAVLKVTVSPVNATDCSVMWTSGDPAVASVNDRGEVTAIAAGKAVITVTAADGGREAACTVTVVAGVIPVGGITLDRERLTLAPGDKAALTATVVPADATDRSVTWKSSNPAVASVDDRGEVTATAAGEAVITVTAADGGREAACTVTVAAGEIPVGGITLDRERLTLAPGDKATLRATVSPVNATNRSVTWKSSNPAVASVDDRGEVTAAAAGKAVITVTAADGGKEAACTVTVTTQQIVYTVRRGSGMMRVRMAGSGTVRIDWGDRTDVEEYTLSESMTDCRHYSVFYGGETHTVTITGEDVRILELRTWALDLDVSRMPTLEGLDCAENQLTSLDVSRNTALTSLFCIDNQLTQLDVSRNTQLLRLVCNANRLTSLDVSRNTQLELLACAANRLTSLDVSRNVLLNYLMCSDNGLTSLDVSRNTRLHDLICSVTPLTADALNTLFEMLPFDPLGDSVITVYQAEGADTCDPTIATAKGWRVNGLPKK